MIVSHKLKSSKQLNTPKLTMYHQLFRRKSKSRKNNNKTSLILLVSLKNPSGDLLMETSKKWNLEWLLTMRRYCWRRNLRTPTLSTNLSRITKWSRRWPRLCIRSRLSWLWANPPRVTRCTNLKCKSSTWKKKLRIRVKNQSKIWKTYLKKVKKK